MNLGPTSNDFCVDCGCGWAAHRDGYCPDPEPYVVVGKPQPSAGIWPLVAVAALVAIVVGAIAEVLR